MQMTADEAISIVREALFCGEHPREAEAEAAIREAFEERDRLRALMAMSTTADEALTALRECAYYDGLGVTSAGLGQMLPAGKRWKDRGRSSPRASRYSVLVRGANSLAGCRIAWLHSTPCFPARADIQPRGRKVFLLKPLHSCKTLAIIPMH